MATFKICVFQHQKRDIDEKYPVSIRVTWKRKSAYIKTEFYVVSEQILQNKRKNIFELRDTAIIGELTKRIQLYEKAKANKLGLSIYNYTASELARYFEDLLTKNEIDTEIDFIEFAREYYKQETELGRSLGRVKTSINAIDDFCGGSLLIRDLTSKYLSKFEKHLKTERVIKRTNQLGKTVVTINKPVSDSTISGYMTDIRTIFNAAIKEYNDDEKGVIKIHHYPFKAYKVPDAPLTKKRNISGYDIFKISRIPDKWLLDKCPKLARDVFMMSFALVGMNLKDIYELKPSDYKNGRITYKRSKTRGRRKDSALISIKVEPEALKCFEKYKDETKERLFRFHLMYSDSHTFVSSVSRGLKKIATLVGTHSGLSSYFARHSWATIARNKCRISKSDVDECLNHSSEESKLADIYIEKDWTMIDESNRKVLDFVFNSCNRRKTFVKQITSKSIVFVRKCDK